MLASTPCRPREPARKQPEEDPDDPVSQPPGCNGGAGAFRLRRFDPRAARADSAAAGAAVGLGRQADRLHRLRHGRGGQSAGGQGRRRHAERRRFGRRRGDRRADGAEPRRAAVVRHRRRRLPRHLRPEERQGRDLRRPRDRADGRRRQPVHDALRPDGLHRRGDRRALGRHARRAAPARARAQGKGPAALGKALRTGDRAVRTGLRGVAAALRRAVRRQCGAEDRSGDRAVLLPGRRHAQAGRHGHQEPGARRHVARDRHRRRRRVLQRRHRRRHRRQGALAPDQPRPPRRRRTSPRTRPRSASPSAASTAAARSAG